MVTNSELELRSVREHTALAFLEDRAFLRISGADATRWLNGMVTNSVQALQPGEGNYNFLLNAQGRIQGDCIIYRETTAEPPSFFLETSAGQIEFLQQHLDRFIIMDDVELSRAFVDEPSLLLLGPDAPSILAHLGLPSLGSFRLVHASTPSGDILLVTPGGGSVPRYELRAPRSVLEALRNAALAAGVTEISLSTLESFRLSEGVPLYGRDIRDRDLPQETNQAHALHFAKGCYLGQEIVERIHSRGQVHRLLTSFRLEGEIPTLPAVLETGGKPAGELTSAGQVGEERLALGYARREALDTHQTLTYSGGMAIPVMPPRS